MKVGDKVKVINSVRVNLIGLEGFIRLTVNESIVYYGVEFDLISNILCDLEGCLNSKSGFYFTKDELKVIESLEEEVPETLTLLDQFAMSALQGVLANSRMINDAGDDIIAKACYDLAKQMIETRKEYL